MATNYVQYRVAQQRIKIARDNVRIQEGVLALVEQQFKVGVNKPRSRGDREEVFGGLGASWKGAFVGGDLLVQALTYGPGGPDEELYGNFASSSRLPPR